MAATSAEWDNRIGHLIAKLPSWSGIALYWMLAPSRHWIRIPAALDFLLCGAFAPIPLIGVWMLPIGLVLLGEDVPWLKAPMERTAQCAERIWTHLFHRRGA
jgi:hypothetical protein